MADDLKIKVNGRLSPVAASPDTPLLYVLTNELNLWGPRFGCGLAQCGSCSVLADGVEIRSCVTPVGAVANKSLTTFEGLAALVRGAEGTGTGARAASAAAGLHRRAGAAVRLLLQRHADQGLGAPGADAAPERSADPLAHGRPSLPLRILSAHHEGDPACVHHDGGSNAMNAILTDTSAGPLSRRDLLKGGGALVVGFCIGGSALPASAARGDVAGPPDPNTIDSWIAVHADNTATVYLGKGEFGQGNTTGLLQIAGEELDLDMNQLRSVQLDTNTVPNQGATTSSSSIHRGGPQVRAAAAEARQALLALASTRLGVQTGSLTVAKGVVSIDGHPSRSVSYGALLGDKPFNVKFTGIAPQKPINRYKLVGTRVPRVDIPDKMTGKYVYMQHVRVPDMLHGRVVRPRGQARLWRRRQALEHRRELDRRHSRRADRAQGRLRRRGRGARVGRGQGRARSSRSRWKESATLPGNADLFDRMRAAKTTDTVIADWGDAAKAFAGAAHVASSTYRCPYQSHAPFAANCALADVGPNGALVMSSTQDIYNSRDMLAEVLGLPVAKVRVQYYEGSGTFGRSCYEDAAQAAAVMSQAVGKPVRVQFMRSDELGWDDYGPAHLADVRAGIDADGKLVAYEYHGWQHGWMVNETTHELALLTPPKERTTGAGSIPVNRMSTGSMYAVANRRVVSHAVPMVGYLKGAPLRSPLDLSFAFASEQTIDELAFAGQDGSARIPPQEHRRRALARRAQCRRRSGGVEAAGRGLVAVRCRGRDRPRHRARHPSRLVWRRGGRDRGQPAHRQHRGHAHLRRARRRTGRSIPRWSRTRSSGR